MDPKKIAKQMISNPFDCLRPGAGETPTVSGDFPIKKCFMENIWISGLIQLRINVNIRLVT